MKINFKIILAASLLLAAANSFAYPIKPLKARVIDSENRNVSSFKGVSLSGSYDYYITQGYSESVRIEAPSKLLRYIVTEVKNGVLQVYTKNNTDWNIFRDEKVIIYITAKEVNSVQLSGSGDVFFKEGIKANSLRVTLSGSGDITGRVTASEVDCDLTGSGDIQLSGRAENAKIKIVGSGDFSGGTLQTTNTYVEVVGSGDAKVNARESLNAKVAGSGDIRYSGNPKNVKRTTSGSGDISGG
jgi:hypothetical protein